MNDESKLQPLSLGQRGRWRQRKANYVQLKVDKSKAQNDLGQAKGTLQEKQSQVANVQKDQMDKLTHEKDHRISQNTPIAPRGPPEGKKFTLEESTHQLEEQLADEQQSTQNKSKVSQIKLNHLQRQICRSIDQTKLSFECELNYLQKAKEQIEVSISELSKLPDEEKIILLLEENSRLRSKLTQNRLTLEESQFNFAKIYNQFNSLVSQIEYCNLKCNSLFDSLDGEINKLKDEKKETEILISSKKRQFDSLVGRLDQKINSSSIEMSNFQLKHQIEVKELLKENNSLRSQLHQVVHEANENLKIKDQISMENENLKECLVQERRNLEFLKGASENNLHRLRSRIEEERDESCTKITHLERLIDQLKEENRKFKFQVNYLAEIRENLSKKLHSIETSISLAASLAAGGNSNANNFTNQPQLTKSMSHPFDLSSDWTEEVNFQVPISSQREPENFSGLIFKSISSSEVHKIKNGNNHLNNSIKYKLRDKNTKQPQPRDKLTANLTINRSNESLNCDKLNQINCNCYCKHCNQVNYPPVHRERYLSFVKFPKKVLPGKLDTKNVTKLSQSRYPVNDDELKFTPSRTSNRTINKIHRGSSAPPEARIIAPGRGNLNNFNGQILNHINTQAGPSSTQMNHSQSSGNLNRNLEKQYNKLHHKQRELCDLLNSTRTNQ